MKSIVQLESFFEGFKGEIVNDLSQRFEQLLDSKLSSINKPDDVEWYSRQQASEFLGCSLPTLTSYLKQGLIPYYRIGRKVFFKKNELIESNQVRCKGRRVKS